MVARTLSQKRLKGLFLALNKKLAREDVRGEIYVVGGAVMCLVLDARPSTRDIDAFFKPASKIREMAEEIAKEENLPKDWLNDGVKGFFSDHASFDLYIEHSHLLVHTATAEYLLAMKCLGMRIGEEFQDLDDIRYLLRHLNISDYNKALSVITAYYPEDRFPQKSFYALEELLGNKST